MSIRLLLRQFLNLTAVRSAEIERLNLQDELMSDLLELPIPFRSQFLNSRESPKFDAASTFLKLLLIYTIDLGLKLRNRKALVSTETELKAIAPPAIIGLSSQPKNGYKIPAAIGIPAML